MTQHYPTKTIRIVGESALPPDRVLAAAYDFSAQRAEVWPAVQLEHLRVHELGESSADVTEGTSFGVLNWERCNYDWSQPGSVKALVKDSNVYGPGSSWEIKATPAAAGSQVEMIWIRSFKRNLRGRLFGTVYRLVGAPLFGRDVRRVLKNVEARR